MLTRSPLLVPVRSDPGPTAPVFLSSPKCPACGREPAIVFHVVQAAGEQRAHTRPVCLSCCPKAAGDC
jgi:hypothetical protein